MDRFLGDLDQLWTLQNRPPLHHLTWDWWWWLVMLEGDEQTPHGKQLMVLWSTKDNPLVEVNGIEWKPSGRPGFDEEGGIAMEGMVAAWWFDGEKMLEPLVLTSTRIIVLGGNHSQWPHKKGGAVVAVTENELSMGLNGDENEFWLRLETEYDCFDLKMTPWNKPMSTARFASASYTKNMGYEILRLHGALCEGKIGAEEVQGTAYFQKVCVQAPSPPWFWGMLHFDDGSYLDWFIPHLSPTISAKNSLAWKKRDLSHWPLSKGGLFHDAEYQRTEIFTNLNIEHRQKNEDLPEFFVELENGRTSIKAHVCAVSRAKWDFNQPTRAGAWSHLTYNEYPLAIKSLVIENEFGVRTLKNWNTIHGNAEHSWGILH
ncbi:MAG: hypothetical protein CMA84_06230 [Euryarchaeota archaeon]|nr:hypothetical protein [Euryarchaeota archaeon]